MSIRKGLLLWVGCIAIVHVLGGSAMAAGSTADGKYDVKFAPGLGIFAIRVVANRPAGTFFAKLGVLILKNSGTGKEIRVQDSAPDYTSYSMFTAAIPEGIYEIKQFENWSQGLLSITQDVKVGAAIGTFQVSDGRMSDLGTMAYVRKLYPVNATGYSLAFDQQERATAYSRSLWEPEVIAAIDKGTLGWQPLESQQQRPVLTEEHLSTERGLINPTVDPKGILRSGVAFGQIVTRSADGLWRREKLPTLQPVTATATLIDGTLIAAADEGLIFMRAPGSQWVLNPLAPTARPAFIGAQEDGGIFVVAEVPEGIAVYHAASAKSAWEETRKFEVKNSPGGRGSHFAGATLTREHLIVSTVSTGFWKPQYTMNSLLLANREWTSDSMAIYGPISSLPGGGIYSMAGPNISQAMKVSVDGGRTWEKRGSPNWAAQPVFRTADVGYLIRVDHIPAFNPEKLTNSLWKTLDGGKTWVRHADLPNQSGRLVLLSDEGRLLLQTNNARVLSSTDDGKSWTAESL
jgi:hypothetical protein